MANDDFEVVRSVPGNSIEALVFDGPTSPKFSDFLDRGETPSPRNAPKYVVSVVLGIRDLGIGISDIMSWSRELSVELILAPVSIKRISTIPFLLRIGCQKRELEVLSQLLRIRLEHLDAEHYIFAHSYGTDLVGNVMERISSGYKAIFLAGAVASVSKAPCFINKAKKVYNDCSFMDTWPWRAEAVNPCCYQATGTYGMNGYGIIDRSHQYRHSDYLKKDHFQKYILPVIVSDHPIYPPAPDPSLAPRFPPIYAHRLLWIIGSILVTISIVGIWKLIHFKMR